MYFVWYVFHSFFHQRIYRSLSVINFHLAICFICEWYLSVCFKIYRVFIMLKWWLSHRMWVSSSVVLYFSAHQAQSLCSNESFFCRTMLLFLIHLESKYFFFFFQQFILSSFGYTCFFSLHCICLNLFVLSSNFQNLNF